MLQILLHSTSVTFCLLTGWYAFKLMDVKYKLFFGQTGFYLFIYATSFIVFYIQMQRGQALNNQLLYNIYILVETMLLLRAAYLFSNSKQTKYTIVFFLGIFLVVFVIEGYSSRFFAFCRYAYISESFAIAFSYTVILKEQFDKHVGEWRRAPLVLTSIGLLIYFICNVPYISLMGYLQEKNPVLNQALFFILNGVFASLRYLLLLISFWFIRINYNQEKAYLNE